jgi:hypothetical protein
MVDHSRQAALDVPTEALAFVLRNAELQAVIAAKCLDLLKELFEQRGQAFTASKLPASFLLELGALGQLVLWQAEGLNAHLPSGTPTYREAAADLKRWATIEPSQFFTRDAAMKWCTVAGVFRDQFAWEGPSILQAHVLIGGVDENALIETLANLLWSVRHSL